jgi:hypothetical protein
VNVGFHDSPANHHAEIARQYPQHWLPPSPTKEKQENHEDAHHQRR